MVTYYKLMRREGVMAQKLRDKNKKIKRKKMNECDKAMES